MKLDSVAALRAAGWTTRLPGRRGRPTAKPPGLRALVLLALVGAPLLFVSGATVARAGARGAKKVSTHKLGAIAHEVDIQTGPVPGAGSTATAAATIQSTPGGSGAQVTHLTFTGPTGAPATFGFGGRATVFFTHGSVMFLLSGTLAIEPGGSLKFAGQGKINGGSERYRRATGRLTFAGTAPSAAPGHVDTFHYQGTISY